MPPPTLGEGDTIRHGSDPGLDELRSLREGGRAYIAGLQTRERERTGIGSLKVGYNKVFGYYIEVTRANRDAVPADYERRQTLTGAERYVTPELKTYEEKVLTAEEEIGRREARLTMTFSSVSGVYVTSSTAVPPSGSRIGTWRTGTVSFAGPSSPEVRLPSSAVDRVTLAEPCASSRSSSWPGHSAPLPEFQTG